MSPDPPYLMDVQTPMATVHLMVPIHALLSPAYRNMMAAPPQEIPILMV